jgi:hypothetical protein
VNVLNGKLARLRFASLTLAASGVARVDSRIGGGVGLENRVADRTVRTPPRKIRARFQEHKHTSLVFVVLAFYELRLYGVL